MAVQRSSPTGPPRGRTSAAFLVAQVGSHAASKFAERLAPLGLSPPHAGIFRVLGGSEGLSQQGLGAILGILPSRLVALVDELEELGFVERRDSADDRRSYALHLTAKGRAMLENIGRVAREHDAAICSSLTDPEREMLSTLLQRVADEQGLTPGVHPGFKRLGRATARGGASKRRGHR
jgi:DNA-binding MarR family transcriptional regulator